MSNKKLSSLDAVTTVEDADEFYVARSGEQKKIAGADLRANLGGSSAYLTEYAAAELLNHTVSGDPASFTYMQFADVVSTSQLGSDLTVVDGGTKAEFHTAAGGSFEISAWYNLQLTANPNDGTTRWVQFYGDASAANTSAPWPNASLGIDDLRPMLHGKSLDLSARATNPYVNLPAGTSFGGISFQPVIGTVDDVFSAHVIVAVWKVA